MCCDTVVSRTHHVLKLPCRNTPYNLRPVSAIEECYWAVLHNYQCSRSFGLFSQRRAPPAVTALFFALPVFLVLSRYPGNTSGILEWHKKHNRFKTIDFNRVYLNLNCTEQAWSEWLQRHSNVCITNNSRPPRFNKKK